MVKGLSKIAKDKAGLYEFGRALRKFDNADFRFRLGNYLTEISEQGVTGSRKSGAAIAKKMHTVLNSSKFPKELADMLQNADPAGNAAKFFTDMATVFAKTNLSSTDMRKILQMKLIYDDGGLMSVVQPAAVMTAGELMENIAKVADSHGADGLQVIKGLAKYADKAVDGSGNISNGSWNWFGPIIHGRRAEIEYLAKHPDATPGTHVTFEVVKEGKQAKIVSDVDAFRNGAAISIKRQGKTLDEWARPGNKSKEWLTAYMIKIQKGLTVDGKVVLPASSQLVFRTGKELPSAATQKRLEDIVANSKYLKAKGFSVSFEKYDLLPPPNIN